MREGKGQSPAVTGCGNGSTGRDLGGGWEAASRRGPRKPLSAPRPPHPSATFSAGCCSSLEVARTRAAPAELRHQSAAFIPARRPAAERSEAAGRGEGRALPQPGNGGGGPARRSQPAGSAPCFAGSRGTRHLRRSASQARGRRERERRGRERERRGREGERASPSRPLPAASRESHPPAPRGGGAGSGRAGSGELAPRKSGRSRTGLPAVPQPPRSRHAPRRPGPGPGPGPVPVPAPGAAPPAARGRCGMGGGSAEPRPG